MDNENKKPKSIWLNLIVIAVVIATLLTFILNQSDFYQLAEVIGTINIVYVIIALVCAVISFILMNISSLIVLRSLDQNLSITRGFYIQGIEYFFNGITPFSTGAQAFQYYYYKKCDLKSHTTTSVLTVNFILYQLALSILSTLGIIFFYQDLINAMGGFVIFIFVGYAINMLILILLFLLAYVKSIHKVMNFFINLFGKIKFLTSRMNKAKEKTEEFVVNFQSGVKFLFTKKRVFILSLLTKVVSLIVYFGLIIIIFYAFDLTNTFDYSLSNLIYLAVAAMLAITGMIYVPLPGASGGTEWAFTMMILVILANDSNFAIVLMLLWRFATYYLSMLYGLLNLLLLKRAEKKGNKV